MLSTTQLVNNRYFIQKVIKKEDFKQVYLAEDQQSNELCYLTKFIGKRIGIFRKELNSFSQLENPSIQKIKYFFENNDEGLWIAQSYIEGESYEKLPPSEKQFNESELVHFLNTTLLALSSLHRRDVIHGNISPKNLILRQQDELPVLVNCELMEKIRNKIGYETKRNKSEDSTKFDPSKDLKDLAITALILLNGRNLFNQETNIWDWENSKILSDQRTQVLKKMLTKKFQNADAVLQALNTSIPDLIPHVPPRQIWYLIGISILLPVLAGISVLIKKNIQLSPPTDSSNPTATPTSQSSPSTDSSNLTPTPTKQSSKIQCPQNYNIIAIACGAQVQDVDSTNFDQGKLTVKITKNGTANDRLLIYNLNRNTSANQAGNKDVNYQGNVIGSFTGGVDTTPLEVTFNSYANTEAVQAIVNSLVYQNVAQNPTKNPRIIELKLTDGDNRASRTQKVKVGIYSRNSPPEITVPGDKNVQEDSSTSITGIRIKDTDNEKINVTFSTKNGNLRIDDKNINNEVSIRRIESGISIQGNKNKINNILSKNGTLLYRSKRDFYGPDILTIKVNDDGQKRNGEELIWPPQALEKKSDSETLNIVVKPVNDPPILRLATGNKNQNNRRSNNPNSFTNPSLSSQVAVNLIQTWLKAKEQAYGLTYERQIISKYTTGDYLKENRERLKNLQENETYYTYNQEPIVKPINQLDKQANQAKIRVKVTQNYTYHYKAEGINKQYTVPSNKVYSFTLQFEDGSWKISKKVEL